MDPASLAEQTMAELKGHGRERIIAAPDVDAGHRWRMARSCPRCWPRKPTTAGLGDHHLDGRGCGLRPRWATGGGAGTDQSIAEVTDNDGVMYELIDALAQGTWGRDSGPFFLRLARQLSPTTAQLHGPRMQGRPRPVRPPRAAPVPLRKCRRPPGAAVSHPRPWRLAADSVAFPEEPRREPRARSAAPWCPSASLPAPGPSAELRVSVCARALRSGSAPRGPRCSGARRCTRARPAEGGPRLPRHARRSPPRARPARVIPGLRASRRPTSRSAGGCPYLPATKGDAATTAARVGRCRMGTRLRRMAGRTEGARPPWSREFPCARGERRSPASPTPDLADRFLRGEKARVVAVGGGGHPKGPPVAGGEGAQGMLTRLPSWPSTSSGNVVGGSGSRNRGPRPTLRRWIKGVCHAAPRCPLRRLGRAPFRRAMGLVEEKQRAADRSGSPTSGRLLEGSE